MYIVSSLPRRPGWSDSPRIRSSAHLVPQSSCLSLRSPFICTSTNNATSNAPNALDIASQPTGLRRFLCSSSPYVLPSLTRPAWRLTDPNFHLQSAEPHQNGALSACMNPLTLVTRYSHCWHLCFCEYFLQESSRAPGAVLPRSGYTVFLCPFHRSWPRSNHAHFYRQRPYGPQSCAGLR